MKHYVLDGSGIATLEALYAALQETFSLPAYFGHNLDAFEECLADLVLREGVISVTLKNPPSGAETQVLWKAMQEIMQDNPSITLT